MTTLTIDRLKAKQNSKPTPSSFEYDGEQFDFFVKKLKESERCALDARLVDSKGKPRADYSSRMRVEYIAAMVCDEAGQSVFTADDLLDVDAGLTARMWDAVQNGCGWFIPDSTKKNEGDSSEA